VRELKNLVERLVVTSGGDTIRLEHLPDYIVDRSPAPSTQIPRNNEELKTMKRVARERLTRELERGFVIEALKRNDWNVSRAARETGMLRPNFHALMRKYRIRASEHEAI